MKAKDVIMVVLVLAVGFLGYRVAVYRAEKRQEIEFRLVMDKAMYEAADRGDLQKVKASTGILLLSDVRDYERRFGAPARGDRFVRDFEIAQTLAKSIESSLVPISSISTNAAIISRFGTNTSITVEPER